MGLYLGTTSAGLEAALLSELKVLEGPASVDVVMDSTFHGGVVFRTRQSPEVLSELRSLDSIYAFLEYRKDVPHDKESGVAYFEALPPQIDWGPALSTYSQWQTFLSTDEKPTEAVNGSLTPSTNGGEGGANAMLSEAGVGDVPRLNVSFRVTCERICHLQKKHGFSSTDAARALGAGIHLKFGWPANMCRFDLEVQAWIKDSDLLLAIPLIYSERKEKREPAESGEPAAAGGGAQQTRQEGQPPANEVPRGESTEAGEDGTAGEEAGEADTPSKKLKVKGAWKDNGNAVQAKAHHADRQLYARRAYRVALVRTALKPSTAYALLRLADIQAGHLVLDPMCGGGTILLEAAEWLGSRIAGLGGDKDGSAVEAAGTNSSAGQASCPTGGCDVARWDACQLPLRDGCVDRIICDMPFGVRCGSVKMREQLSPRVAREVARVLPLGTGRAVLMAQSKAMKQELLNAQGGLFTLVEHLHVEMEGIRVDVMVVQRTWQPLPPLPPSHQARRKDKARRGNP